MGAKQAAAKVVRRLSGETLMVRSLDRTVRPRLRALGLSLLPQSVVVDIGAKNAIYRSFFGHCRFATLDVEAPDIAQT